MGLYALEAAGLLRVAAVPLARHDFLLGSLPWALGLFGLLLANPAWGKGSWLERQAPKVLGLKFDRLNPLQGLGRMFSLHGLAEMVKAILKSVLVGGVAALVLWYEFEHLFSLITACAERPLQLHVTQGLGHHRLLGDRSVIERVVGFIEAPAY